MCKNNQNIERLIRHFKPLDYSNLSYGTAGFRYHAEKLEGLAFRVGLIAALRSVNFINDGFKFPRVIGAMVTASHNPPCDNGIKLVDPDGSMLSTQWEPLVTEFIRCSIVDVSKWLSDHWPVVDTNISPHVVIGYDTRASSPALAAELKQGIESVNGICSELGLVTTPQLHYAVKYMNSMPSLPLAPDLDSAYVERFASKFVNALNSLDGMQNSINLYVDCAHGVGALVLAKFVKYFTALNRTHNLNLLLFNTNTNKKELLNERCGADFVKLNSRLPELESTHTFQPQDRWATIDGDADRLLYFYPTRCDDCKLVPINLLDGDRMSCLIAKFVVEIMPTLRIEPALTIGVIQTAYANMSSTRYLTNKLQVSVVCVSTGVKYLHSAAQEFDFGIYFEANGHGSVHFSGTVIEYVKKNDSPIHPLRILMDLTNTAIGDAITNILLVEYILAYFGWSLTDWYNIYTDLPYMQLKLAVMNPSVIKTTDAERKILEPIQLQNAINAIVLSVNEEYNDPTYCRAFIRPSGTENIVRIFAESPSIKITEWLVHKLAVSTYELIGGIGPEPMDPGTMPKCGH